MLDADGVPREPSYESVLADLALLREKGLVQLRRIPVPALQKAAQAGGFDNGTHQPGCIEELLRAAVDRLGDGTLGQAARYTFGLVSGTRDWPAYQRRRRGAQLYGVGVDRFRKHYEKLVLDQTAEEVLALCRAAPPAPAAPAPSAPAAPAPVVPAPRAPNDPLTERPAWAPTPIRSVEEAGEYALSRLLPDAVRIDLYGRTLASLLNQYAHHLRSFIRAGGTLRVLVLDPAVQPGEYLYPLVPGDGHAAFARNVAAMAARFRLLTADDETEVGDSMNGDNGSVGGRIQIRTTRFLPPYSMLACVPPDVTHAKILAQINLMYTRTGRDRPLLCLDYDNPWYAVFAGEFEEAWRHSAPWREPVTGITALLQPDQAG